MEIDGLWHLLARVHTFQLNVFHPEGTCFTNRGQGIIRVEQVDASSLTWQEQGEWIQGPLTGIRFNNTTHWQRSADDALRVSHQRRGPEPVFLSTLRPWQDGTWQGDVHYCGADHYRPSLKPGTDDILVRWEVASPSDPYRWEMLARV